MGAHAPSRGRTARRRLTAAVPARPPGYAFPSRPYPGDWPDQEEKATKRNRFVAFFMTARMLICVFRLFPFTHGTTPAPRALSLMQICTAHKRSSAMKDENKFEQRIENLTQGKAYPEVAAIQKDLVSLKDNTVELGQRVRKEGVKKAEQLGDESIRLYQRALDEGKAAARKVEDNVREKPLQGIAWAFVGGFVASLFLRRR
jgi:ElaB/YqjD/DUF883 family membrane-anchored ribosome-binding protein